MPAAKTLLLGHLLRTQLLLDRLLPGRLLPGRLLLGRILPGPIPRRERAVGGASPADTGRPALTAYDVPSWTDRGLGAPPPELSSVRKSDAS